ncbi:hypothetical protein NADFUDRAFT_83775 [Nadsonia fulvescens var. elongata DSM 6958]|uniref:Large ribosomal subunit protein mL44 n=1 Tax=Nadsonia fulvescens var. elongata DSM 6958 TaxID=857566 RepID=A0A1E3PFN3_9ASCO|nr:hypothetical protein NADFUDRAFT_83775 [Nadsonia fulvescens var. elongata DSM 6958]
MLRVSQRLVSSRVGVSSAVRALSTSTACLSFKHSQRVFNTPQNRTDFGSYSLNYNPIPIPESEANLSPALHALRSRLQLTNEYPLSTLGRALTGSKSIDGEKYVNNAGMAQFGKNLINYYVTEHFLVKYPRLPTKVLNEVAYAHFSESSLSSTSTLWGIEVNNSTIIDSLISAESEQLRFGKLRFAKQFEDLTSQADEGIIELTTKDQRNRALGETTARAQAVQAIIAGIYAHRGRQAAREFIINHLIKNKKVDIDTLLQFPQATRELSRLCTREGLESPVSRLLAETGRNSAAPVFIVGVFSGNNKLGEGQGASLREAKTRAAVNALKGWYLYSPLDVQVPSITEADANTQFKSVYVDKGTVVI